MADSGGLLREHSAQWERYAVKKLDNMDRDELLQLRKDVDAALKSLDDRRRKEAQSKLEDMAREMGFSLSELTGGKSKSKTTNSVPRYVHPENPAMTWSGRGRQPEWFKDAIAAGKTKEELAI
jgi:DNA-binding protein H-NS